MQYIDFTLRLRLGRPYWTDGGGVPANQPPVTAPDSATTFAGTDLVIDVIANDLDPEGGALDLISASAVSGTVSVADDDTLLYRPAPGFSGTDTVTYTVADAQGAEGQGTLTVTVKASGLAITANAEGTLTVEAARGRVTITVASPPVFAGSYEADTADLDAGPVSLAGPAIEGEAGTGAVLTARPGLWIFTGAGVGTTWAWRRDGAPIAGAEAGTHVVTAADEGAVLTVVETLTDGAGSRSAESAGVAVPLSFTPDADPGLVAWFDAADPATITETGGLVTQWADRTGAFSLGETGNRPTTGTRTIGGLNAIDFDASDRLVGPVTLPAGGNMALHAVIAIDSLTSAFAAILAMDASRDFQIDANSATAFAGRLNVAGSGDTVVLSRGPYAGVVLLSAIFDRTGTGTAQVWINGALAGSGAYTAPLDSAQSLHIMTNRSRNAFIDGAVGEVIVTATVANRAEYQAYLASKWGIA